MSRSFVRYFWSGFIVDWPVRLPRLAERTIKDSSNRNDADDDKQSVGLFRLPLVSRRKGNGDCLRWRICSALKGVDFPFDFLFVPFESKSTSVQSLRGLEIRQQDVCSLYYFSLWLVWNARVFVPAGNHVCLTFFDYFQASLDFFCRSSGSSGGGGKG